MGLGRAPGTDQQTMRALRGRNAGNEIDFGDMIEELLYFFEPAEPGQKLRAIPGAGIKVPIYILGSSLFSAQLAARTGRPYAFAGHFAPGVMMQAFDVYRSMFQPSSELAEPYVIMGIPVVAAESDEKAKYLATSVQQAFLGLIRGNRKLQSPPVPDMDTIWSPAEKASVQSMLGLLIAGGLKTVREKLDTIIEATGADEIIITSDTFDHADRVRSYEFIAQAKKL